jgi:tRNA synthetase class I (W and Y)
VGEDQKKQIELAADIAQRFNRLFGEVFVIPQLLLRASVARIMGLEDPTITVARPHQLLWSDRLPARSLRRSAHK